MFEVEFLRCVTILLLWKGMRIPDGLLLHDAIGPDQLLCLVF